MVAQFLFWGSLLLAPALNWWALSLLIPSGLYLVTAQGDCSHRVKIAKTNKEARQ